MSYNEAIFTLDTKELEKLQQKLSMLPKNAEYELNNFMWNKAGDVLKKKVMQNMPRSKRDKSNYKDVPKTHAKDVESLDKITYNLGIKVQTKLKPKSKDFGYLIFPDEGRGKHQKIGQDFFGKALESEADKLKTELSEYLNKKIEEELNNGNYTS